jgi:hypothetical protein
MAAQMCEIESALGRAEPCPGVPCPFWSDDRCVVAGLRADLGTSPELAEFLLRIRDELGAGGAARFGLSSLDTAPPTT